jgi:hypothetical protein
MVSKVIPLSFKVLREHKIALNALATLEGECTSVILRRLIRVAAEENGVWPESLPNQKLEITQEQVFPIREGAF